MQVQRFDDAKKTGRLIRIPDDWAFVPDGLPPAGWALPREMFPLLIDAHRAIAKLDGIGRTLPKAELLLVPLQRREAIRSSSLEGTYATPEELLLFELDPREPRAESDRVNDWREVHNYGIALRHGADLLGKYPLSLRVLREMHRVLLAGVRGRDRSPGEFRRYQVHIGADRRYVPPPESELMPALDNFEKFLNQDESLDPLVRAFFAHYQFEAIHPFVDGNGRVGRALLALCVFKWLDLSKPWLYMSPFFERYKDDYIDALFAVSTHGQWDRWIDFCLRGVVVQAEDAIVRCDSLLRLKAEYRDRLRIAGNRAFQIVESLFANPVVRITDIARLYKVTYPTAKADLEQLEKLDILGELDGLKPRTFYAPEIIHIAHADSTEDISANDVAPSPHS